MLISPDVCAHQQSGTGYIRIDVPNNVPIQRRFRELSLDVSGTSNAKELPNNQRLIELESRWWNTLES
ncbi:hypothetical protein L1889_12490 [Paenalcaligenes niemegkensis]|uniref:hypothetical protein n=1 Tax=Paenalcaligenes niemegkensis TaxID=2895469 RepID=UPI001EE805FE|nr:hypothetical protein [Paenalcaligenes niemegkensis]MCQ9617408.1 hypothetical protein [Paenalcaligenes niemegkensis]